MFSVHALKSHMDSLCQPKQYEEIETDAVKLNPRDGHMQQHPPFVKTRQRKVVLIENYTSRNGGRAVMCAVGSMIWWERVVGAGQIYSNWKFNAINCVRKRFLYFSHSIVVANAATNPQTTENSLLCTWIIFLFGFVDDDSIRLLCACFLCSCSQFILHPPLTAAIVWIGEINYWFRRSELRTWSSEWCASLTVHQWISIEVFHLLADSVMKCVIFASFFALSDSTPFHWFSLFVANHTNK